ncbi:MAG: hypothetical protein JOZ96_20515 [Acidobacteria bacterium]|nr:hypothetical protein [Acidobacteriota bacterium]
MRTPTRIFIFTTLLCVSAATAFAQGADAAGYKAVVKKSEARFTMPVPARDKWKWRMKESRERAREYAFDVKVVNEGQTYTFGFFLWKNPNSSEGSGGLSSLLAAGQKNLFAHTSAGLNTIVRDVDVVVTSDHGRVVITVKGGRNVARLFSGRPAEVTFETQTPDEPLTSQTVPVVYEN